ncbi:hypothetical protein PILCRDRAFT_817483 [Piloderma croceum F 1598]|uniref:Uncharacterized protein n=1 Tax=Piloderma croceum (strain F 1598) TaxID=765440 RepID=A0A0C3G054_PILCF|nr:hypothetical protein PILCRDRAFT_817483 [Piloderma croceum F 1598]
MNWTMLGRLRRKLTFAVLSKPCLHPPGICSLAVRAVPSTSFIILPFAISVAALQNDI